MLKGNKMRKLIWIVLIAIASLGFATISTEEKVEYINFEEPIIIDVPIVQYTYAELEIKI